MNFKAVFFQLLALFFFIISANVQISEWLKMAKRISKSAVNWALITESFVQEDKQVATAVKLGVDKYLRELGSKPAELPKIDWNHYKNRITAPGMVEIFQKSYEALTIPYPSDQGALAETEEVNKKLLDNAEKKDKKIKESIKELEEKLKELSSAMRYVDMTMEEFYLARPDLKIDPDNPEHWPHLLNRNNQSQISDQSH